MDAVRVLRGVDELLCDPSTWIKRAEATKPRDDTDAESFCEPWDIAACRWCLRGAINRVWHCYLIYAGRENEFNRPSEIIAEVNRLLNNNLPSEWQGYVDYVAYNDHPLTTFDDIKQLLSRAIAEAEECGVG